MPGDLQNVTRADLPEEFTPESIRSVPLDTLRRLARPGNGVLAPEEQSSFDSALHQMMRETAGRVSRQINKSDWATAMRDANRRGARSGDGRGGGPQRKVDEHLNRLAKRIDQQVEVAEALAPGVDWSFAQPAGVPQSALESNTTDGVDSKAETVSDLEQRLTEQVELVQVMSEIAEVSQRTYALEQQRDLQSTRGVFFGFVVSVAVLVAGWAPMVAADWNQRIWIIGLTLATCIVAGLVYGLIRTLQNRSQRNTDQEQAD